MGYVFRGFITKSEAVARAAEVRWAFCEMKEESKQLGGYVFRCPTEDDLHPTEGDEGYGRVLDQIEAVRVGLPVLSQEFPEENIVYVEVTCFGGTCTHEGFHALGGKIVKEFETGPDELDLSEILRPLGIQLDGDQFFEPFTRGYFDADKRQHWAHPGANS